MNEIDLTGQAYDEMQEQNDRLLQQLTSKDDANFKLMSDRINANQKQSLLSAQIEELEKQVRELLEVAVDRETNQFSFRCNAWSIRWRR